METKKDRISVDSYTRPLTSSDDLKKLLLQGKNINHLNVTKDEEIELFCKYQSELLKVSIDFLEEDGMLYDDYHELNSNQWYIPVKYQQIDVKAWLLGKCKIIDENKRVNDEYVMFEERNLVMLLRLFIYLVDYMRKNKLLWGVGRGSSTSSYCLYLIGIHRVNSLKYQLDIRDFLK